MAQGDKDDPRNCPKCGHFNGPLHEYDCPAGTYGPKLPSLDDLHAMGLRPPDGMTVEEYIDDLRGED
jgi:hypothetical protein